MRWTEEVELLQEEMGRVLRFFSWQGQWWEAQASRLTGLEADQLEGVAAYAMRQANIRREMHANCVTLWLDTGPLLATWKRFNPEHAVGGSRGVAEVAGDVFD